MNNFKNLDFAQDEIGVIYCGMKDAVRNKKIYKYTKLCCIQNEKMLEYKYIINIIAKNYGSTGFIKQNGKNNPLRFCKRGSMSF